MHLRLPATWWRLAWCITLTGVVLWPFVVAATGGSALVLRDMVVPGTMALNDLATGVDGVARAVPQDAVLAAVSPVIPPPVVVGLLMCAAGVGGSFGATLLARDVGAGRPGQMLAALLVLWNPYVAERLLQGHWSVVAAGMLLPMVALTASARSRRAGIWLVAVLAVCALTPTGLILGVVTAVVAAGWRRRVLLPLVAGAVLSLPWVVPSVIHASGAFTDSRGAALFAARAEPLVGTLGALAGLGGIWNADAVPDHRIPWAGVVVAIIAVAVAATLAVTAPVTGRWKGLPRRLSLLGAVAVVVPALLATGPGLAVLGVVLESVPGAGLVRDTQKFVVLALPALVVLLPRVDVLLRRRPGPGVHAASCAVVASLVVAQVPALPADLSPLRPTVLDARYDRAVDAVEDAGGGRVLMWPPGNYRVIDGRPALDPLLKMLPGAPVDPGYLIVDGQVVDGDPATVRLLTGLAEGRDGLTEAGIDLVLVEGTGVTQPPRALSDHDLVWSDGDWELYRVRR